MKTNDYLIKPLLTEKSGMLVKNNIYSFVVNPKVTKSQIKKLLEEIYQVKIEKVMIKIIKGKTKRVGKLRKEKKLGKVKIAQVKLLKGDLPFFPK